MHEQRIDRIARHLVGTLGRRRVAGGLSAALIGGLLLPASVVALCRPLGSACQATGQCCAYMVCRDHHCRCRRNWDNCGTDKCFPLLVDPRNCGACGNFCPLGATCVDGACA
jgi:hypothetical protein